MHTVWSSISLVCHPVMLTLLRSTVEADSVFVYLMSSLLTQLVSLYFVTVGLCFACVLPGNIWLLLPNIDLHSHHARICSPSVWYVLESLWSPPKLHSVYVCVRTIWSVSQTGVEKTIVFSYTDNTLWMKASGKRQWHKRAVNIYYTQLWDKPPLPAVAGLIQLDPCE